MGNDRKIHWKSWYKLTITKKKGWNGVSRLENFQLSYTSEARMEIVTRKGVASLQMFFSQIFSTVSFS